MSEPLRILVVSSLFPSLARPRHGIFVETRLRHLLATGNIEARVVSPVPWFPLRHPVFGRYAALARIADQEVRDGIRVSYPRYPMVPGVGMSLQPAFMTWALQRVARRWAIEGWAANVIDAHYFYPDGVAAARLARRLDLPYVVTARGSDLNLIAERPAARRRIVAAARDASRVVCVSQPLRERAIQIGIHPSKVTVLRNGVDSTTFDRADPAYSRTVLGMADVQGPLLLCVGNLVPEKGHRTAVEALMHVPNATLLIVGEGPEEPALLELARSLGILRRVRVMPPMEQRKLALAYSAATISLLPSLREGWPNVVLESLACGTPVVATNVGAVAEMLTTPVTGRVCDSRDAKRFADAIRDLLNAMPDPGQVRMHAQKFAWAPVATQYRELLLEAAASSPQVGALSSAVSIAPGS